VGSTPASIPGAVRRSPGRARASARRGAGGEVSSSIGRAPLEYVRVMFYIEEMSYFARLDGSSLSLESDILIDVCGDLSYIGDK
jgi:hypothetical protein